MNNLVSFDPAALCCSVPSRGKAGVGASGASTGRSARPHPGLPPAGEGALQALRGNGAKP
ncbi:hypothetical protein SAMN05444746_12446 [Variovorax sp. OK212]|nr:hypothetical protein SAMN05518853_12346 [Variovorax sp. OK202]SFE43332.1 hypothetical protein SAMN05444746_12446 [Variovorax sp. OK212]